MKLPIRVRMTAWYAVLLAVIITAVGAFLVLRLRTDLTAATDRTLRAASNQIAIGYRAEGPPEARDVSRTVMSGERAATQVLDPAGRVIVAYGDPVAQAPMLAASEVRRVLDGARLHRTAAFPPAHARFRVVARATKRRGRRAVVVAAQSMAGVDRSVHRVLVLLLIAGPGALLATAAGGWWLARRSLRPIERLRGESQEIGVERLQDRLAVPDTGDEVARLATTLNTMLARIEQGVEEQHRLIADASHELRSPLAAMRSELDVSLRADELPAAAREVLESTRAEVDRVSRTVEDMLTLASADEHRLQLAIEPVDVADLAAAAVSSLRPLARSRAIGIELDATPAIGLADARHLRQAVANLVDNAIKYSPHGATIRVRTGTDGADVVVWVDDEGPGVPPELRERVFDRFFRLDASRTRASGGSGIGLSIVREVARAHGGRAWVDARSGGGSTFALAVPAVPPELLDLGVDTLELNAS